MTTGRLFKFCQFDLAATPGPDDGRYLVREPGGEELAVVAVKTLGARSRAPRGHGRRLRRAKDPGDEPGPVTIRRFTAIAVEPFGDETAARDWLAGARRREAADVEVAAALVAVNRVIHAHRLAARDPYENELWRSQADRIRLGYGSGDEVAEGRWREALAVAAEQDRRLRGDPDPQVARILSGRSPRSCGDDLVLRARLDLDQGRIRQALLQARIAVDALAAEGASEASEWSRRLTLVDGSEDDDPRSNAVTALDELVTELERFTRRRMQDGGI